MTDKKYTRLLIFLLFMAVSIVAHADDTTFDFSTQTSSINNTYQWTIGNITLTFQNKSGSSKFDIKGYWTGASSDNIVISSTTSNISKVVITFTDTGNDRTGGGTGATSSSNTSYSYSNGTGTIDCISPLSSVTWIPSNKYRISKIVVTTASTDPSGNPLAPILSPAAGTIYGAQAVTIVNQESGVDYYYRKSTGHEENNTTVYETYTDWSPTSDNWSKYENAINVDQTMMVSVVAVSQSDNTKLTYMSAMYTLAYHDAQPVDFSLESGEYTGSQQLALSSPDGENMTVFYHIRTADESSAPEAGQAGAWTPYTSPLTINSTTTVDAYADGDAYNPSPVTSRTITIRAAGIDPGLKWSENSLTVQYNKDGTLSDYTAPTLTNPYNLDIVYNSSVEDVASIDATGKLTINGVGTTVISASYISPKDDPKYNAQEVTYTLTVLSAEDPSLTFESAGTRLNDNDEVPNGTVVKLDINNYPVNYVVKVALNDETPSYLDNRNRVITRNTEDNFQYIGRGIPIYTSDSNTDGNVKINVSIYNPDNSSNNAVATYSINLKVDDYDGTPARPVASPSTSFNAEGNKTVLTTAESSTISGDEGNIIYAKYSNNLTYSPRVLLAENNVSQATTKVGVFSTVVSEARRVTAIQVKQNVTWTNGKQYDIASNRLTAYYEYTQIRHNTRIDVKPNPILRDKGEFATKGNTEQLDASFYVDNVLQSSVPDSIDNLTYISSNENVATVDDNGLVTLHEAGTAVITISCPQRNGSAATDETHPKGTRGFDAATSTVSITVTDQANATLVPPTFNPSSSRIYHAAFNVTVYANDANETYPKSVGEAYYVLTDDPTKTYTAQEILDAGNSSIALGGSRRVNIPSGTPTGNEKYTIWAVTYNPENSNTFSAVTSITFTYQYIVVDDPDLTPGIKGGNERYEFSDDELAVTASTTTPMASIYYTVNQNENDVDMSNGTLYDGTNRIRLTGSSIVRAVAYYDGVYSNVVTYRYRKMKTKIDRPTFTLIQGTTTNDYYRADGSRIQVTENSSAEIKLTCRIDNDNDGNWDDMVVDPTNADDQRGFKIYYSTDGVMPTPNSPTWTADTTFDQSLTIIALCQGPDGSTGLPSTLELTIENGVEVWEANENTCDADGQLYDRIISKNVDNKNTATAPKYVRITIGDEHNMDQKWQHTEVNEICQGHRIEGYGSFDLQAKGSITDANTEEGDGTILYNHSYAQLPKDTEPTDDVFTKAKGIYESTFHLPAHGTFVKIEPERDGTIYFWCLQNGGLHYSKSVGNVDRFYNQFIRKRPVYLIDEQGQSVKATGYLASGTLNKTNWDQIDRNSLLGMDQSQDGLPQDLFTLEESQDLYDMYYEKIQNIKNDYENLTNYVTTLNDGSHQAAAGAGVDVNGDNVVDGTGYCLPSASHMKYWFPVKAGKTYFFFCLKSKIGISAIGFKADNTDDNVTNQTFTLDETSASNSSSITAANADNTYDVTVKHSFKPGIWTTIVLPFSVSETQVRNVLGEGTDIIHFTRWDDDNKVINMTRHYYHQMIVAGTPVFIKPGSDFKPKESVVFSGVHIDPDCIVETVPHVTAENDSVHMMGSFDQGDNLKQHDFYLNKDGQFVQRTKDAVKAINGMRAWLRGFTETTNAKTALAFVSNAESGETTDIIKVSIDKDGNITGENLQNGYVYNLRGQLITRDASRLNTLPAGVYILNGKKYVVR